MKTHSVWHLRMQEYYRELDRQINNEPQTGLLTTKDNARYTEELRASINKLQSIAAVIERELGYNAISRDIKAAADRLRDTVNGVIKA